MFTLTGGQKVGSGTYWDITTGLRVDMDQEGALPGEKNAKYLKASAAAILLAGPILGFVYIIALPIMGVITALGLLLQKTLGSVFSLGRDIVSFGWRPSESYLGGKNKKKEDADEAGKPKTR
jgi:urea transporter